MTVNAHDAEEQLRPYLGRLYDIAERMDEDGPEDELYEAIGNYVDALQQTIDKALELLGVQK